MKLPDIFSQTIGILRFIAAPFASFSIVWLFLSNRILLWNEFYNSFPSSIGVVIILGVIIYYCHRIVVHPIISSLIVRYINKKENSSFDTDELQFDRWRRRGSDSAEIKSIQIGIDEASAASHFFYCISLNAVAIVCILKLFPDLLNNNTLLVNEFWFWIILVFFFSLGFFQDRRTSRWDRKLFRMNTINNTA
jgi:hypothetical protein